MVHVTHPALSGTPQGTVFGTSLRTRPLASGAQCRAGRGLLDLRRRLAHLWIVADHEVAVHEGDVHFSGGCCSFARLRVAPNGALVEDD